jgi:predicted AAA+ superfamily ATPase
MPLYSRTIENEIQALSKKSRGRILAITGARQVGKSTLAKKCRGDYQYINLDSPVERSVYTAMLPEQWLLEFPRTIVDEVQKCPAIFETLKACYDQNQDCRYLLLGSSQVLLLRETLAGRVAIRELYPFTIPELIGESENTTGSLLIHLLKEQDASLFLKKELKASYINSSQYANAAKQWAYFCKWGGMPALLAEDWNNDDRFEWLLDYQKTYLQRDLADLANLQNLDAFIRAQKFAALRTANTINYSDLANMSDITSPTAKKFIHYLEVSYQAILLPSWHKNKEKRLSKMPKLHFLDPGICRAILQKRGEVTGSELESAMVSEIYKQLKNARLQVELFHLRTSDGREIDLLLELEHGYVAIECKQSSKATAKDARHLKELGALLDKPLLTSIVVSHDLHVRQDPKIENLFYIPFPYLLGTFS